MTRKTLKTTTQTKVRFSEVDSMGIVWHGNYIKYLEDGREAFGREYGLGYLDVYQQQALTPIVKVEMDYKQYIKYGEDIIIETEYINTPAAKLVFKYKIFRAEDKKLALTAQTTQVFVDKQGELMLTNPEFYVAWKTKWGLTL